MRSDDEVGLAILKVLQEMDGPAGAARIADRLLSHGIPLRPRSVRFHLLRLDREGLTRTVSRRAGRALTPRGREEVAHANVIEKVGFAASRMDSLGYRMTFRPDAGRGTITANVALVSNDFMIRALEYMKPVFVRRLGMGALIAAAREGEELAGFRVPRGMTALATVCSVTVNGILLGQRIPVTSRFGGLLELRDGKPARFLELIEYRGTTIDPLDFYIRAGTTSVRRCALTGDGVVGASFREIPAAAVGAVEGLRRDMDRRALGGILGVGRPNLPLLDIPVSEGQAGLIVMGGLNPFAAVREAGGQIEIHALAGLEDISRFVPFQTLRDRYPT
jgi:repressor of nif and glnA expression